MASVVPVAKALSLCDYHVGYSDGKVDLYGLFNAIRPEAGYPYTRGRFCIFVQLINGLGQVPFFVDIRDAESDELIWNTEVRQLWFPNRTTIVQLALSIVGCGCTTRIARPEKAKPQRIVAGPDNRSVALPAESKTRPSLRCR